MNTVLKRKISSVIAGESIVENIGGRKSRGFCGGWNGNGSKVVARKKNKKQKLLNPQCEKQFCISKRKSTI